MITPERAQEIIQSAHDACTCGPWSDWLDRVMQPGEREEVNQVWETMPGYTCFVDAIYRIARTHIHNWNIERGK